MEEWKFAFQVLQFLLTGGIGIYVYMSNKDKVTNSRITVLETNFNKKNEKHGERLTALETSAGFSRSTDCTGHAERINKLEASLGRVPTRQELSEMHEKINDVSACVSRLEGEFSGAQRTLTLIHETLMERK